MFKHLSAIGMVHLIFAFIALGVGLLVVLMRKGTRLHRTLGHIYFTSMLGVNITALCIYRLFGGFGVFHVLAFVSLAGVISGVGFAVLRRPLGKWLEAHRRAILWSYAGLLAAFTAEIAVRVPKTKFWPAVVFPSLLVTAVAWFLINKNAEVKLKKAMGKSVSDLRINKSELQGENVQ